MNFKVKPWKHQMEAIARASNLDNFALFFEMGAGKTSTVINIARAKILEKGPLRVLVFCPPVVIGNWREEWLRHSELDPKGIVPLTGSSKKRLEAFQKGAQVFITNYEVLTMEPLFDAFFKWKPDVLIFDESHKLKDPKSKRAKQAEILANPPNQPKPFTYILSGSPVLNSPLDIFHQFKILDGGASFGKNFWAFRGRYFRDRNAGIPQGRYFPRWEPCNIKQDGFDALGEINQKIYEKGMRVEKRDCLDLPPEISTTIKCSMSFEQAKLYQEMKRDLVTFYNSQACTASLAITKALRLMQITSGFVSVEYQDLEDFEASEKSLKIEISLDQTPKLEALRGLLEECLEQNKKVIVWAVWKENYRQIAKLLTTLKAGFVEVHGGVSASKKQENIIRFQTDPACAVYLGHPGSGGIGVNLTVSDTSIFYSRTFSLEHYLQARARNHRGGSKEAGHQSITHYDLVCEGTIDESVVEKLSLKQEISDQMLLIRDLIS